jgi:hypothetical protein
MSAAHYKIIDTKEILGGKIQGERGNQIEYVITRSQKRGKTKKDHHFCNRIRFHSHTSDRSKGAFYSLGHSATSLTWEQDGNVELGALAVAFSRER